MKKKPLLNNILTSKEDKEKNFELQKNKVGVKLMQLDSDFKAQIKMEVNAVNTSKSRKKENAAALSRLKNAYYCLQLTYVAMDRLDEISSTHELTKSISDLSSAMKMINKMEGKADNVNSFLLRLRTKKMLGNAAASAEGGMREHFSEPIDELVDDSVVQDLLSGKSLNDILYDDVDTINNIDEMFDFCDEFGRELDGGSVDNYEQGMRDLDNIISKL